MSAAPVFYSARLKAWPKHADGGRAKYTSLSNALTSPFTTDVHTAQYSAPHIARRLDKSALHAAHVPSSGIAMARVFFDIDAPSHVASDDWWTAEQHKISSLLAAHLGAFVYRTRGGYRAVYEIETRILRTPSDAEAWSKYYLASCRYLRRGFDIDADESCCDWTRLFRLPHSTRDVGGKPEALETAGDAHRIGLWRPELASEDYEDEAGVGKESGEFCSPALPLTGAPLTRRELASLPFESVLCSLFKHARLLGSKRGDGVWLVACPFAKNHTDGRGFGADDSSVIFPGDFWGKFHCAHSHCRGKGLDDVLRALPRKVVEYVYFVNRLRLPRWWVEASPGGRRSAEHPRAASSKKAVSR